MKPIEANFDEQFLLPPMVEDWLATDHPARFIREIVADLNLAALGFAPQIQSEGRPPYANRLLLRVWLYAYFKRIHSTRKVEEACRENMAFIWLSGNTHPDHNTLWRFFAANRSALRQVFRQTVRVAARMNLVGLVLQAVDGTRIAAACSSRGRFDRKHLEELLGKLDEALSGWEKEVETEAGAESPASPLPAALCKTADLRQRVVEALKEVETGETSQVQPADPEARRMPCSSDGRNLFGYNAQAVVDDQSRIIVAAEVVNEANDNHQLAGMIQDAAVNTGKPAAMTVADSGYSSREELLKAREAGVGVTVPLPSQSRNPEEDPFHASRFNYELATDTFHCPGNRHIPFQYERIDRGVLVRRYRSAKVCRDCPLRSACTRDPCGRQLELRPGHLEMEQMRGQLETGRARQLLTLRKALIEPVFAQIKHNGGFRRWTFYGLEGVRTQWNMLCAGWNLRQIYRCWVRGAPTRSTGLSTALSDAFCRPLATLFRNRFYNHQFHRVTFSRHSLFFCFSYCEPAVEVSF
jgi:transposase